MTNSEKNHEQQTALLVSQGNPAAMKELYCATAEYLTAVCARYISDNEDVKDILQDSYVKIFTSAGKFEYRGEGSLRAWMTRIVVNDSLKFLRDSGRNNMVEFKEHLPETADDDGDAEIGDIPPEELQRMIRSLPAPYRTVFNLYVFQEKTHKDIARILGMAPGTSASCLHRAKTMLVRMINGYRHEKDV